MIALFSIADYNTQFEEVAGWVNIEGGAFE
jgi:hypothetical protein